MKVNMGSEPSQSFVLFGATGDLAQRMLFPSLYHLMRDDLLPKSLNIVGAARSNMKIADFRAQVAKSLEQYVPSAHFHAASAQAFVERLTYVCVDVAAAGSMDGLVKALNLSDNKPATYYLAVSPKLYGDIAAGLAAAGLVGSESRVVLEKPIGHDVASSIVVNESVGTVFKESQIFRIDHYLGKETVQNLMALRFGNSLFEPLWNATGIEQVQITVSETVGLEGRAAYYDGIGALKDMVQNHMLQLLALVAMEPPSDLDPTAVRNEKIKVLRSLKPITGDAVDTATVAGQYVAGAINGNSVKGYAEELGSSSDTNTFVALRAEIDNWRWAGVPFYLRTGKRLPARYSEIFIQFRSVPHSIFARQGGVLSPNKLLIRLQPEENISLMVMAKEPGINHQGVSLRQVPLNLSLTDAFAGHRRRIAYERLILDVLHGNPTLFVRRDEIEAAWQWIDGIAQGWRQRGIIPKTYAAGTWGPSAAIALTERHGHSWHE